jgi:hypothetical protein
MSPCFAAVSTIPPSTFTVVNTNDYGLGSLRDAIVRANAILAAGPHVIQFNIPGPGPHVIGVSNEMTRLLNPMIIDGFSEPGSAPNTLSEGNNGIIQIRLDGSLASPNAPGLVCQASNCTIRGLSITGFGGMGMSFITGSGVMEGCWIGLAEDGTVASNKLGGVFISSMGNRIGGNAPSARNVISGNLGPGITLNGSAAISPAALNQIMGNYIGTDPSGSLNRGNASDGIRIVPLSFSNLIGGTLAGEANRIAFNSGIGVSVQSGIGHAIRGNEIFENGQPGIQLGGSPLLLNDPRDLDTGPNDYQNYPVLLSAVATATNIAITGSLNSRSNFFYLVDFYASSLCDPGGYGEGRQYLGTVAVNTDANGDALFGATLAVSAAGRKITATATDTNGSTSGFSRCLDFISTALPRTFTVVNTNDAGAGSFRQAILEANAYISQRDTITFNLPDTAPLRIEPLTPLPEITDPVLIDGYTQPGSSPNESSNTFKAVVRIVLLGDLAGPGVDGLRIQSSSNCIRGMLISRFTGDQIKLISGDGNVIEGNYIGTRLPGFAGTTPGNGIHIVAPNFDTRALSQYNLIGGDTPAAKNSIVGNSNGVRIVNSTGNRLLGNSIGVGGFAAAPNAANGIELLDTSANHYIRPTNYIGGPSSGSRNIISGNGIAGLTTNGHGIRTFQSAFAVIQGNFIGTDETGLTPLPNLGDGIRLEESFSTLQQIGGTAPGEGNVVSGNGRNGISVSYNRPMDQKVSPSVTIQGNLIGLNASGTSPMPNQSNGVSIANSRSVLIGGAPPGAGNVVAANRAYGMLFSETIGATIQANKIGTDRAGVASLGNGLDGVRFQGNDDISYVNLLGGTNGGEGNTIAFNTLAGVSVAGTTYGPVGNMIEGNSIFSNGGLGIDLGVTGVNTNDPGDLDSGPNRLQNYPLITAAFTNNANLIVCGQASSSRLLMLRLEFFGNELCDASGFGEGKSYLGFANVQLDSAGKADFVAALPLPAVGPAWVTATATDPGIFALATGGNTSEFSPCVPVGSSPPAYALGISRTTNAIAISWPDIASGFVLQSAQNLNPPIEWQPVTNGIATIATNRVFTVTNSAGQTNYFFRLKKL